MMVICKQFVMVGIRWMGPLSSLTHAECPHCGGRNRQRVDHHGDGEDSEEEPDAATPPRVGAGIACAASAKGGERDER